ncbi:MAG: hypothetical protein M1834_006976 [Cirrosporium novae-zelandiae]|nr:MAG: hypothetical protein M1834_006976 [Cirrosporium novae-zelandiae]
MTLDLASCEHRTSQLNESTSLGKTKETLVRTDALAPFKLLSQKSMTEKFSIRNVLNLEEGDSLPSDRDRAISISKPQAGASGDMQDPVSIGLVNLPTAQTLFDSFMKYLNPFICQFDPILHTFSYVQQHSSFLLTAILAAAARAFNPSLVSSLRDHCEALLARSFINGEKSTEIIQAIMLSTYWKEADDTRSWQLVGHAARVCLELRWNKLKHRGAEVESEIEIRERRNIERTYLVFISLQLGKPWMLHVDDFIRGTETWYACRYAVMNNDAILSAFVELRKIGPDILELISSDLSYGHHQSYEIMLNLFNTDLDKWEERWYEASKGSDDHIYIFLIRFYGVHFRLFLNSFRLQLSLFWIPSISKQALRSCFSSASQMIDLAIEHLVPSQLLYFAQDSVHVMMAYAAVFLMKVLLSLSTLLPENAETSILDLLQRASDCFASQCLNSNSSCAYQARFLKSLVAQYERSKGRLLISPRTTFEADNISTVRELTQQTYYPNPANDDITLQVTGGTITRPCSPQPHAHPTKTVVLQQQQGVQDPDISYVAPNFTDSELWGSLFADAGFSIDEGMFLPAT